MNLAARHAAAVHAHTNKPFNKGRGPIIKYLLIHTLLLYTCYFSLNMFKDIKSYF